MSDEDWRDVLRVNLDGTFYVTRDVGRVMAAQRAGTMILMTSDRGLYGSIDYAHYAASKGGMIALMKSLALTMGKHGVTVNGVNPGLTDTPLARAANPQWEEKTALDVLGKHSQPEEIAEIVLFLAGTAGAFMTGQTVTTPHALRRLMPDRKADPRGLLLLLVLAYAAASLFHHAHNAAFLNDYPNMPAG